MLQYAGSGYPYHTLITDPKVDTRSPVTGANGTSSASAGMLWYRLCTVLIYREGYLYPWFTRIKEPEPDMWNYQIRGPEHFLRIRLYRTYKGSASYICLMIFMI